MKAVAVFPAAREVKLIERAEPEITSPDQVLLRILEPISLRDINLSNIVSRPLRRGLGVYCFVLTLDRHASDPARPRGLGEDHGGRGPASWVCRG